MKICVFCSANWQIDRTFFFRTDALARWAAREGHTIVFGGAGLGLMECLAKVMHEEVGRTIGVVPQILTRNGNQSKYTDVEVPCDNLNDRKQLMQDMSDAFIALPGGLGTLDEIFTVVAAATMGYHQKPVILYNMGGFWDSLIRMLDDLHSRGVTRKDWHTYIKVAHSLEEVKSALTQSFSCN